jgi:hypothetical protein
MGTVIRICRPGFAIGIAMAVLAAGCTSHPAPRSARTPASAQAAATPSSGSTAPIFDPTSFVAVVDNPYYPLKPGAKWVYQGMRDGVVQRDLVEVTNRTRMVDGVRAIVETDVATHNGTVLEKTEDWYAQDKQGNVWYLGESTVSYDNGVADTEGSWTAGVGGALPGIIMPAHPRVTDSFRQEFFSGQAEDMFWVVEDQQTVKVQFGTFRHVIRTLEFTRLEPDVIDTKFYAPGIGIIREASAAGPQETADLVSFTTG